MSHSSANYPQALEEAFNTFNRLSGQLADSYSALETRVASLNEELAHAHNERFKELTEKERLANRLSSLLNALPGGVVVLNKDGVVAEHNSVAAELLGEPLHGVAWQFIIKRCFSPRNDDGHDISLRDGRKVNISTCPLGTEPGQILLITDVTEVRKLQDRLNQHQRLAAMGEMAASLAHQIRTPLSSAILYSSQLKRQNVSDSERQISSEKIINRLRHLEHVVNDMLLYAKGTNPGMENFTVEQIFSDTVISIDPQISSSDVQLEIVDKTGEVSLHGNRQMLSSALTNLVVNAIQILNGKGTVKLFSERLDDLNIRISVTDNGPGFSEDAKKSAFVPFFTTRKEGTGLGLAVVDSIVSSHDGMVKLESEPGKGASFILTLPIINSKSCNVSQDEALSKSEEKLLSMR